MGNYGGDLTGKPALDRGSNRSLYCTVRSAWADWAWNFALVLNLIFIVMVKLRMYAMAVISNKILLQIRQDLYEHIQTLSFSFLTADRPEKILARVSSGMSIP